MAKRKSASGGAPRGRKRSQRALARPRQRTKAGARARTASGARKPRALGSASGRKRAPARPKPKASKPPKTAQANARSAPRRPPKRPAAPASGAGSTLDLDRSVLAIRTGRRELKEHLAEHTETGPILTGGDIDANWEQAFSSGDEAPGGDNPTPDQDVVEEVGRALGVEYQDNEELRGAPKLEERDRFRWEYNPASSEDYAERTRRRSDER